MTRDPLNFPRWLAANSDRLQPPVSNFYLYDVNSMEEWSYQIKGRMLLLLNQIRHVTIREGEMFLVDANTPHSPVRTADTVGLVMEMVRPSDSLECLCWYCAKGNHLEPTLIYEESFMFQILASSS
ncbi:Uncharacterized protein HZ326_21002 [Fusarium oxysporum f. sp. albedinis]|nr:Uncharacterized protein HZ326_21002 [Fusarium oxysporum f. sp. albedinis]